MGPRAVLAAARPTSPLRTPAIFFTADYNCQQVPVCLPQPRDTAPDPLGPGNKDEDFRRLRAAGVDTMKVALRAAVHLDWTEWPELNGSRYGAITTLYYTLAWFDRYVKGDKDAVAPPDRDALRRLGRRALDLLGTLRPGHRARTSRRRSPVSRPSTA